MTTPIALAFALTIAQPWVSPSLEPVTQPPEAFGQLVSDVAAVQLGNETVVVWLDRRVGANSGLKGIFGVHVRADGTRVEQTATLLVPYTDFDHLALATDGTRLLLVWSVVANGVEMVVAQRFSSDFQPLDAAPALVMEGHILSGLSAVWNGTQYAVVSRTTFLPIAPSLAWIASNGVVTSVSSIGTTVAYSLRVASAGGVTAVLYEPGEMPRGMRLVRYAQNGAAIDTSPLILSTSAGLGQRSALASDGTGFLAMWSAGTNSTGPVSFTRLGTSGPPLDVPALRLTAADDAFWLGAARSGTEWHLLWQYNQLFASGQRVNAQGGLIGTATTVGEGFPEVVVPRAAGGGLLVGRASGDVLQDTSVFSSRYDATLTPLDTARVRQAFAAPLQEGVGAGTNGPTVLLAWFERRTSSSRSRLVAARIDASGASLDGAGIVLAENTSFFAASGQRPSVTWDGTQFVVTWAERSASWQLRAARVSSAGARLDALEGFPVITQLALPRFAAVGMSGVTLVCSMEFARCVRVSVTGAVIDLNPVPVLTSGTIDSLERVGVKAVMSFRDVNGVGVRTIDPLTLTLSPAVAVSTAVTSPTRVIPFPTALLVWRNGAATRGATFDPTTQIASAPFAVGDRLFSDSDSLRVSVNGAMAGVFFENAVQAPGGEWVPATTLQRFDAQGQALDAVALNVGGVSRTSRVTLSEGLSVVPFGTGWSVASLSYVERADTQNVRVLAARVGVGAADGMSCSAPTTCGSGICAMGSCCATSCSGSELRPRLLEEVEACVREHSVRVFVDSGAFSEVAVVDGALVTVRPLTAADWERRLCTYERLARSCGRNAYLVAPDKVGDQLETLARLELYAPRLRALREVHGDAWFGPHLIVPVQRGALSMAEFASRACDALGLAEDEVVWGIPMKKSATSLRELTLFARSCPPDAAFHLLGMGPASPRFEGAVLSILAECSEARITSDAVRVTALVGRGDNGAVRPLTAAQDAVRLERPGASSSTVKRVALERVLGAESRALLLDNGWMDAELPPRPVVVPESGNQLSLLSA